MTAADYTFDRCILCCKNPVESEEHVLPESLGGKLKWRMMCEHCNAKMGHRLIAQLKTDPMIALAINAVELRLPDAVRAVVTERMRRTTVGPDDKAVLIERRKGKDKVVTRKANNDSLIADTSEAPSIIRGMTRSEADNSDVAAFLAELADSEEGTIVHSRHEIAAIKHPVGDLQPVLGQDADDRALGIIALGYLALLLGNAVCDSFFDPLRGWLKGGDSHDFDVERFYTRQPYETTHALLARQEGSDLVIQIAIFGAVRANVRIPNVVVNGNLPAYVEDLAHQESLLAETLGDAVQGRLYPR